MFNYYRNFIQDFAKIASPIYKLLKKNEDIIWTTECQKALDTLKEAMKKTPVLAHPDIEKPFILYTDASYIGLGFILAQEDENQVEHPIRYGSWKLRPAEQNYPITELECAAVIWEIKQNSQFLGQKPVTIVTDHKALENLKQQEMPTDRKSVV